jgi:hypothetical protein
MSPSEKGACAMGVRLSCAMGVQVVKINNMILTPVAPQMYDIVLDKLYQRLNMTNHRYQMMTEPEHIKEVKSMMACPHIHGFNYLMFLTNIDNKTYNFVISKKELRSYRNQNKQEDIKIYTYEGKNIKNQSMYKDTIFDGKIIKTNNSDKGVYMIYDAYVMCGQDVTKIDINKKYTLIEALISDIHPHNTIKIELSKMYKSDELLKMVKEYDTYKMNGVVFVPKQSGKWYIYVNDKELNDCKHGGSHKMTENKPVTNESQKEFIMRKTDVPDVYELYWDNGIREGIAAIPNLKTSHHCRDLFRSINTHKIMCIKSNKFNKWIPLCQDVSELSQVLF